jgi:hypothetical protein
VHRRNAGAKRFRARQPSSAVSGTSRGASLSPVSPAASMIKVLPEPAPSPGGCPDGIRLRESRQGVHAAVIRGDRRRQPFGLRDPTVGYAMSRGSGAGSLGGEPAAVRLAATSIRTSVS